MYASGDRKQMQAQASPAAIPSTMGRVTGAQLSRRPLEALPTPYCFDISELRFAKPVLVSSFLTPWY